MTYNEAIGFIAQADKFGSVLGLERIRQLLAELGHPERTLKFIHVAGTNGKGSICAFIENILRSAGYKTGRYISPTIYDYRERIQADGRYIDEASVASYIERIASACTRMQSAGFEHPTVFEIETAMSFLYFNAQRCDFVILEVGLGGRYDSTNVIEQSIVSVIGLIGLDHTEILGQTIAEIAYEKAGIIKRAQPVVIYDQDPEALDVIMAECIRKRSEPVITEWAELKRVEATVEKQVFNYRAYHNLTIPAAGLYQMNNAAVAVEVYEVLRRQGIALQESHLRRGLEQTKWPGRFELLRKNPVVIADGAHNPDGIKALVTAVKYYFPNQKIILIMGVFKDKDYQSILAEASVCSEILITHQPDHQRGLDSSDLAAAAQSIFSEVYDAGKLNQAVEIAMDLAHEDDVIISFGSLSTIGEFCDIIKVK